MERVSSREIIELIESADYLSDCLYFSEIDDGFLITNEWFAGGFAGREFFGKTKEDAAEKLISYMYSHIGRDSVVGEAVRRIGFPDMELVKKAVLINNDDIQQ